MYEIKLHSEFIGDREYWYFMVESAERVVLLPTNAADAFECSQDIATQTLADRIGRFMDGIEEL